MVACELTENAIKYGEFQADDRVMVSITERPHGILVEVKNRIAEGDEDHLVKLDEMIQWIRGFQAPFEAYLVRLEEVSKRALEDEESGLGLVRIAREGQSLIDFYVHGKNTLAVSAVLWSWSAVTLGTSGQFLLNCRSRGSGGWEICSS